MANIIALIVAMTKNRVIGKNNSLPWRIPEDLQNFKKLTLGSVVIMGRKTFESIGKPLPGRTNIVVTRTEVASDNVMTFDNLNTALEFAKKLNKDVFFIGGASVYAQAIPLVDKMFISYVKKDYDGDVLFPEFNVNDWQVEKREEHEEFELVVYMRK